MENIVIPDRDFGSARTYVAISASSGDSSPAVYRRETGFTTPAQMPTFKVSARPNGPKTARRVLGDYAWPMVKQDSGGNIILNGGMSGNFNVLIPQNQTLAQISDQAWDFAHLVASEVIRQAITSGIAPK